MMDIDITKLSLNELDMLTTKICSERARRKEKDCFEWENKLKDILDKMEEKGFYVSLDCHDCGENNQIDSSNIRVDW